MGFKLKQGFLVRRPCKRPEAIEKKFGLSEPYDVSRDRTESLNPIYPS